MKWLLLIALFIAMTLISFSVGKYPIGLSDLYLLAKSLFSQTDVGLMQGSDIVFWQIRLPRVIAAAAIGSVLSAAGASYQGMFRNPLVSPDILGVASGAALGALLAIFLGLSILSIQLFAFIGGMAVVGLVYFLAGAAKKHDPVLSMVLVGIAVGTLCTGASSLLKVLADPYTQLPSITYWLLGGLTTITVDDLYTTLPIMVLGLIPLYLLRWRMNILSLPDEEAQTLGVNVRATRIIFIMCATLMTACAVSISGILAWIGLVVPHIARLIVGPNFSRLLPASLLLGATFLLFTDTLSRTIAPIELPLSIITAGIGAPFFLMLLIQTGRKVS
jgi:iron complex transport system permease protein